MWKDLERVLKSPRDFAGEEDVVLDGLEPRGAFHISYNIVKKMDSVMVKDERVQWNEIMIIVFHMFNNK